MRIFKILTSHHEVRLWLLKSQDDYDGDICVCVCVFEHVTHVGEKRTKILMGNP